MGLALAVVLGNSGNVVQVLLLGSLALIGLSQCICRRRDELQVEWKPSLASMSVSKRRLTSKTREDMAAVEGRALHAEVQLVRNEARELRAR